MLFVFSVIKAASAGHYPFLAFKQVPELGAPFGAQWNDFPITEDGLFIITGLLARSIGIFAAVNAATMFAHVLAALTMYATCRLMRCAWVWAFAAGLIYGFATYAFAHGAHHINITYYWLVPLGLLVCRWLTVDAGMEKRGWRFRFALVVGFLTGLQNAYYTFMFLQLAAFGGLVQWMRRGWMATLPTMAVGASTMGAFLLMNLDTFFYRVVHGPNPAAVMRNYQWMEFYALKIMDLLMPFPGHWLFSGLVANYFRNAVVQGETPPPSYLGVVSIAGVIFLAVVMFVRLVKGARLPVPLEAAQMLWIVIFSTVGGLNCLLGAFGFQIFRAGTRYSIFIMALAVLFLVRRLSPFAGREAVGAAAIAGVVVLFALLDQTPPFTTQAEIQKIAQAVASDKTFTEELEARLSPGAMVFQLPIMDFPESPAANMPAYDHFRPYLFSKHLRFSFGSIKGRLRDDWAHDLTNLKFPQAVDAIERYGFAAMYVNRNGFADKGEGLIKTCRELGRSEVMQSPAGDLFCVILKPAPNPVLPIRNPGVLQQAGP